LSEIWEIAYPQPIDEEPNSKSDAFFAAPQKKSKRPRKHRIVATNFKLVIYHLQMSQPSSDEDVPRMSLTPKKTPPCPLSKKTPPVGPASSKKRPLQQAEAAVETPGAKKRKIHRRNVLLWKHFQQTKDPNVVICIANPSCGAKIRRPDGSTSGMRAHFEARHPVEYTAYLADTAEAIKEKV
jgi:hypothetical protein